MRNTLEWYVFIDKITKSNKQLFFYLENKFYDPGDSLIIGIKAMKMKMLLLMELLVLLEILLNLFEKFLEL